MTGHSHAVAGRPRIPLLAVASSVALILLLPGCTGFRQLVGLDQNGPDEFAVESRAPLTIPPEFALRPPQPGSARPQEVTASDRARQVVDTAGPGKPGDQAVFALKTPPGGLFAAGEQADPNRQVGPNSLASKLLTSNDTAAGGTGEKRETTPLKGVY